ncbi:FAD/NAD(P)-binding domain-containing protein [Periconia macrospinosa]|uniref:FAD/NAD(P)-binding domain-containing protein n=1 Tax=Periconia macrospinosa TaxID=97972 RepID=A0A2V1D4B8_9PLEO|nr:FAD/NAD(P)-binding domain-containing protein [Periconia macrospinosa]
MVGLTNRDSHMETKPLGSYPDSGIDVLVVGTGLGGLSAALECKRKGHQVRVLERNTDINVAGDMYFMGLSGTRWFKHWPDIQKRYHDISLHNAWIETYKHSGEIMIPPKKVSDRLRAAGLDPNLAPGEFQMRPLVYKMFFDAVENAGIKIEFGRKVVDYFEDESRGKGGCITEDGTRYEADVVIAADGVGSKSQKLVGGQVRAESSGRAMWRAAFPKEHLDKNPEVKEFFKMQPGNEPIVRTFLGPSTYALTLSREDVMVWIMNHDVTGSEEENWNHTIESKEVLDGIDNLPGKWCSIFKELVRITPPNTIVNFPLFWRNPQPSWASPGARVIQVGDCAHSYLPSSGNGATQAIEDSISLASCLQLGGKDNIPEAVRTHIRFRFIRNACAQKMGLYNAELLQSTDWDKVKLDPRRAAPKHPKWIWEHDPEAYVYENYEKAVESLRKGVKMEDEDSFEPNYPKGYKYEPWDAYKIMEDMRNGVELELKPGNWD